GRRRRTGLSRLSRARLLSQAPRHRRAGRERAARGPQHDRDQPPVPAGAVAVPPADHSRDRTPALAPAELAVPGRARATGTPARRARPPRPRRGLSAADAPLLGA